MNEVDGGTPARASVHRHDRRGLATKVLYPGKVSGKQQVQNGALALTYRASRELLHAAIISPVVARVRGTPTVRLNTCGMRFTLHYEGPLPARRGSSEDKAHIRDAIEGQLKELWVHQPLSITDYLDPEKAGESVNALTQRHDHTWAALVSEQMGLRAELDVLMLTPRPPGSVVHGGDIDNRVKTLLDALSAPAQANQVPPSMRSTSPTDPKYVLLDDDRLVTRLNVETERLLGSGDPDLAYVTVRVNIGLTRWMMGNQVLLG